jgi:acyl-CoA synthetase (NDP forming)
MLSYPNRITRFPIGKYHFSEAAPGWMNVRNPVDVGPSPQFPVALEALLDDPGIDIVLGIAVMPYFVFREVTSRGSTGHNWFGDVAAIRERHAGKPFAVCAVGHSDFINKVRDISGAGVPVFVSPEAAVKALAALRRYAKTSHVLGSGT